MRSDDRRGFSSRAKGASSGELLPLARSSLRSFNSSGTIMLSKPQLDMLKAGLNRAGFRTYREYLDSPHRHTVRARVLNNNGTRCWCCNRKKDLQVHHKSYKNIGNE